jgi:hypothetical protein
VNNYHIVYFEGGYNLMDSTLNFYYKENKKVIHRVWEDAKNHYEYSNDGINFKRIPIESEREIYYKHLWERDYKKACEANGDIEEGEEEKEFFILNPEREITKVLQDIEKVEIFGDYYYVQMSDSNYVYDQDWNVLFSTTFACKTVVNGCLDIYNHENQKFGFYNPHTNFYIAPTYQYISGLSRGELFVVVHENKVGYLDSAGNRFF